MKKIKLMLASSVLAVSAVITFMAVSATNVNAADCSRNAVITCGFSSISQLRSKYNTDTPKGTQTIFHYFDLTSTVINSATYKDGYVTKTGNVVVDGKTVATNALTAGREYMPGSSKKVINGTTFYTRTPSVSFSEPQHKIIAFFDSKGRFIGASMYVCGNPIKATNKVVPPAPKPVPVYTCDSLVASKISRDEYSFTTTATAKNGATIKSYAYDFGDGTTKTGSASIKHTYSKPGSYVVKATVRVDVDGKSATAPGTCVVKITVAHETCPVPGKTHLPKDSPLCKTDKPGVSVEKTVNGSEKATVALNTPFTYEVVVKNVGNVALKKVVVTDEAPEHIRFVSSPTGMIENDIWSTTLDELAVGESKAFTINAEMTSYQSGTITNTVCVETPTVPGGNPDDCDTADVDTPTKPELPAELPETGTGSVLGGAVGLSAIAGAVHYYGASRRNLSDALLKK